MNLKLKYDVWFDSIFVNKTSNKKIFERISIYSIMYRIWPTLNFIIWRKTAHSQFSKLFNLNETPVWSLKGKEKKEILWRAMFINWDEAWCLSLPQKLLSCLEKSWKFTCLLMVHVFYLDLGGFFRLINYDYQRITFKIAFYSLFWDTRIKLKNTQDLGKTTQNEIKNTREQNWNFFELHKMIL
jgi:hypothetical protein